MIGIRHLGRTDYEQTWRAMQAFTQGRDERSADEIWLTEHPPVFTQGLGGRPEHVLDAGDIPVVHTDRGGQVTYHGPGQVVAYTLFDLRRLGIGVRRLVEGLEQAVIDAVASEGITAARRAGAPGVYVDDAKLAALGLRVRRGCSYHGLALNVAMDLAPFARINPCGLAGLAVTDLRSLGVAHDPALWQERLATALRGCFESEALVFYALLKAAALPPGFNLAVMIVGLALSLRWRRLGLFVLTAGIASLYLVSTGAGVRLLAAGWEQAPLALPDLPAAQAIVVLGGGRRAAPEYPRGETVSIEALPRLRYAARLHRETGLPLLVSGGRVRADDRHAEATLMAEVLTEDFAVPVRWREARSRDTFANARESAALLRSEGIGTVVLVTQAAHMPRAREAFEREGLTVIAAPTIYLVTAGAPPGLRDFIPTARHLYESEWLLHERLGVWWYRLRRARAG